MAMLDLIKRLRDAQYRAYLDGDPDMEGLLGNAATALEQKEQAFTNGYSAGYSAGRRSAGATGSLREQTVADSIRSKTDEGLRDAVYELCDKLQNGTLNDLSDLYCDGKNGCIDKDGNITCTPEMEKACVLRWLRSLAKEV